MRKKDLVGSYHDYVRIELAIADDGDVRSVFVPPYDLTVKSIKAYPGTAAISEAANQAVLTARYGTVTMGSVTVGTVGAYSYAEVFSGNQECLAGTPVYLGYGTVEDGLALELTLDIEYVEGTGRAAGTAMP